MYEHLTRQEKIRISLSGLDDSSNIRSIQMDMFPGELKRFRNEFPNLNLDIMNTSKTPNSKIHVVKITRKDSN